jgi:phosphoglycerate dehydrogenase-like enzyme
MESLGIFCTRQFSAEAAALLREGVTPHRLVGTLPECDVAFGQPDVQGVMDSARVRWVQVSSAGYTAYDRSDLRAALEWRGAVLTKSSVVYDEPCAEHLLALLLAQARQLPASFANQLGPRGWPMRPLRASSRLLRDQAVVIVGFGTIGSRLCQLLAPLGMKVTALRRTVAGDEPVPTFAVGDPRAAAALAQADHVIDVLPASAGTEAFFDRARFDQLKVGAAFYNVGRGSTVDQDALAAALGAGRLAAAYLDVTTPEPLPPDHPLWVLPGCFIGPHTAGGHHDEHLRLVRHFLDNLARFVDGRAMVDRIF